MPLTDTAIRKAKPAEKPYKLTDEKGLFLLVAVKPGEKAFTLTDEKSLYLVVSPLGAKYWRFDYRYAGKRKTLALGVKRLLNR